VRELPKPPHAHLLDNLMKQLQGLCSHTNSRSTMMDMTGDLGNIQKMWLNKCRVVSIVSLKILEKIWPISYHSKKGMNAGHFIIHANDSNINVRKNSRRMPFFNLKELEGEVALCLIQDTINMVQKNMEGFTKCKVEEAKAACKVQGMLGHPTDSNFLGMVASNMIANCDVTKNAVKNANPIFRPDLAGVRGRTVRTTPEPVCIDYVQIPMAILDRHSLVTLTIDCMFVNGVPFLVSVPRGLNLITAEHTPSRTAKNLTVTITRIMALYARGGFQIRTVLMDNEFKSLQNLVPILVINTTATAAKEHVPEIKQRIRLIKERGRGTLNTLPYKKIPQLMLIELIYHMVLWLNVFLTKSRILQTLSP
jgi:hypothetical protein